MQSLNTFVNTDIQHAEAAVREALAKEGFGVLTEIDVAATFQAKLGISGPALKILGACNPSLAHKALSIDPSVALMLPCNVVLSEENNRTSISIADPRSMMTDPGMSELAQDAAERLNAALATLNDGDAEGTDGQ
ncbi:MAG TPA: DUF302 domain-containing protein [Acidimicrobiales bacterium]|nr:DUF302 domain-containing protein [Acidimicrobiales bacterium]